jgi:hypothetical protein
LRPAEQGSRGSDLSRRDHAHTIGARLRIATVRY